MPAGRVMPTRPCHRSDGTPPNACGRRASHSLASGSPLGAGNRHSQHFSARPCRMDARAHAVDPVARLHSRRCFEFGHSAGGHLRSGRELHTPVWHCRGGGRLAIAPSNRPGKPGPRLHPGCGRSLQDEPCGDVHSTVISNNHACPVYMKWFSLEVENRPWLDHRTSASGTVWPRRIRSRSTP
jgi:hypothetical protein